jgi:hypothetical protein
MERDCGEVQADEFLQVAFIIRNQARCTSTAGWGCAEWVGSELKSYGADASFPAQCIACHSPLKDNDYVFMYPSSSGSVTEWAAFRCHSLPR